MKRTAAIILILSIPVLLFFNAWQSYRFDVELGEVRKLEAKQRSLLESNKQELVGIEALGSPTRIDELAEGFGELVRNGDNPRIIIEIEEGGVSDGGS